jgi:hypothetical protein
VHFRQPTVWEQYRWPITAVAAIIPLQSILIGYVLIQDRRRRKAEAEATQQRQEVAHLMRVSVLDELSGSDLSHSTPRRVHYADNIVRRITRARGRIGAR